MFCISHMGGRSDLFSISLEWEIIRQGHFGAVTRKRDVDYPQDMGTKGFL